MTAERFNEIVEQQLNECKKTLMYKASEYATADRLHNFKVAADLVGATDEQALAGMMAKHIVSIFDMCGSGKVYPIELWNEKIGDSINYMLLLKALVLEEKK